MVKVVLVSGVSNSGKTTFEHICQNIKMASFFDKNNPDSFVDIYSSNNLVFNLAKQCGWDGKKTEKSEKFLSELKKVLVDWNDMIYKDIRRHLYCFLPYKEEVIVFIDYNDLKELSRFKKAFKATTLLIRRLGDEVIPASSEVDISIFDYKYDYEIKNYGSLEDLREEAYKFLEFMNEQSNYDWENRNAINK